MEDYSDRIFKVLPRINYASIISNWYRYLWGNSYNHFMQFELNREQAKVTPKRTNILMNNMIDIIEILHTNARGMTSCSVLDKLDRRLEFIRSDRGLSTAEVCIELGGKAIGTMAILDELEKLDITERIRGHHYLKQEYRDAIDNSFSLIP
jgi:hypothetical protein